MTTLAYAIEPSDAWYFAQLDCEEAKRELQEEFIKRFKENIAKPRYFLNRINTEKAYEIFDDAMQALHEDEQKSTTFIRTLLSLWANPCGLEHGKKISELIDKEIEKIAKKEFGKNPNLFDW